MIILCESDGASVDDFENIQKSKGGVLIIKVLVRENKGKLEYKYNEGILRTRISLDLEVLNENYNI